MTFPSHKCSLTLEHNEYKDAYESIEAGVRDEDGCWVSPEERQKALDTGDIWVLHWHPETPVGFYRLVASSLETLLEHANKV